MSEGELSRTETNQAPRRRLRRWLVPSGGSKPKNPPLARHEKERAKDAQNRVADAITRFAGSMTFVYIHIVVFTCWIGFGVEKYPFGLLTVIVSLEAIFLSTFVLISQNRSDARRQVIVAQQWTTVQKEDSQNQELLQLLRETHALVKDVHSPCSVHEPEATDVVFAPERPASPRRCLHDRSES